MRRLTAATAVLAAAFVLVGIGTPLLGVTVFAGADLILVQAPWSSLVPSGFVPQNPYVGDTVDGFLPASNEFVQRLRGGDFAQWWPYNSGGGQLGSVPDAAVLSPLSFPYLFLPLELAPGYVKLLELLVAIGGSYLFLRRLALDKAAAVLGGLVFASSGFMIAWTNWPQTRVAAFIPALFWAVERLVQRRRPGDVALVAALVAAMLFGGFPAVTWYALVAAGIYCALRAMSGSGASLGRRLSVVALAAAGVVLGVAVAAFQLLPFVQELGAVSTGSRAQSPGSHSPLESLVLTLAPDALGGTNPTTQVQWFGLSHPVEEMSYVGAAALVLVALGVVARRRPGTPSGVRGYFVVATLLTVTLVFLGGPLLEAAQQLPVFGGNRIGRARSVLGFFAAVLAAFGFDALLRSPAGDGWSAGQRRNWRVGCAVAAVLTVGAGAYVVFFARRVAYAGGHPEVFEAALARAAAFGVVALVAVVLAYRARGVLKAVALVAVPVLVGVQALLVVLPYWPRVPPEQFYPETPTHRFLAEHLGAERLVSADAMLAGTEAYYGLRTSGGRGFIAAGYRDLLRHGCVDCFVSPTYVAGPEDPMAFDADVLDRLATKYLVTDPAAPVPGIEEIIGAGIERVELTPGEPLQVALPSGGMRAVGVVAAGEVRPADPWARLDVVLRDAEGRVVVDASRRLIPDRDGGPVLAAVPELAAADATTATITLVDRVAMPVRGSGGVPEAVLVRPVDDDLRIVDAGGATVYERLTALPRIRWASSSVVEPDELAAARLLSSGGAPEVVLSAPGPQPSGLPAAVDVLADGGDTIEVVVEADGAGYLVVADALQDRWTARLDGDAVELRAADVGLVAVAVPAGRHVVRLDYEPPAGGAGYLVSGLAGAGLLGLAVTDRWRSRRRRTEPVAAAPTGPPTAQRAGADDDVAGRQPSARR